MKVPQQLCQTTGGVFALLHLRSAPRSCEVLSWGYNRETPSGKRDILATTMLCVLLVATAFAINGFTSALELVNVQTELCDTQSAKLADNRARMHNVTNYEAAFNATSYRVNLANDAFMSANDTYNRLGTVYTWPEAYELSEDERQDLEEQAISGGEACEPICVDGAVGIIVGIFGDRCKDVPCPDIGSTELLVQYDASQQALDLFGEPVTVDASLYEAEVDNVLNQATSTISVLVERINFASSCYVLYLAFLVVFPTPFVVYRANWKHTFYNVLANVNKPLWIVIVVVVWYAQGAFRSILDSSLYRVTWANFVQDPCWADASFLVETASTISQTCVNITSAHNLFSQASNNYRYYEAVENTWEAAGPGQGPFYAEPDDVFVEDFPGNCSASVLLEEIQPSDGNVNWFPLLFYSGAAAALLLQFMLANWLISWFTLLRPLTVCRGRIMLPYISEEEDHNSSRTGNGNNNNTSVASSSLGRRTSDIHDDVRGFIRMRAVLPLLIHTVLLALVLFNLAVARSEEGMDRKVLWSAAGFAALIVLTAACLYRPSDETSPAVVGSEYRPSRPPLSGKNGATSRPSRVKVGVAETGTSPDWSARL